MPDRQAIWIETSCRHYSIHKVGPIDQYIKCQDCDRPIRFRCAWLCGAYHIGGGILVPCAGPQGYR